jgi:exosortase H (IPTLxxWG-CTERM-specific)
MLRTAILFAVIVVALFALELTPPGQHFFVEPWTTAVARVSAAAIQLADPAVIATGAVLVSTKTGFAVAILAGCNGVEAMIVLAAGMLAFPAPWKHRVVGILAGTVAIQALNLVRIASLFYIGQWNRDAFEWAHLYLWQSLIMLDALVVWVLWLRSLPSPRSSPA